MNFCHSDLGTVINKCNAMLSTPAISSCDQRTAAWSRMVPLTVKMFQKYWEKISDEPMFDLINAEFCEWDYAQKKILHLGQLVADLPDIALPVKCVGMRHRKTKKPHGIVRGITTTGNITEATWVNGKTHGLIRNIPYEEGFI